MITPADVADIESSTKGDRSAKRAEYDAALRYVDGDMQDDTESALARAYGAAQTDTESGNRIEAVAVALVQLYVDEMASLYTGSVVRKLWRPDGSEATDVADKVSEHLERIGYDQRMSAVERRVVLARSCGLFYGVDLGRLDPVVYPPQDIYPVYKKGTQPNRANQDACAGHVLDMRSPSESGRSVYAYSQPAQVSTYSGAGPHDVHDELSSTPNALTWSQPVITKDGKISGDADQPLQPLVLWHAEQPVNEILPLSTVTLYRANRWLNVLWSVILDVVRFQCGATLSMNLNDPGSTVARRPVGVRFPLVLEQGESASYMPPGNDFGSLAGILSTFAKTLGLTLRISPDDLSLERTAESGIARQIANIPKDRARAERARHFTLLEKYYAWPRIASALTWLGVLGSEARGVTMTTEFRPMPMPTNRAEQITIEKHDLEIGLATPAKILAERVGISEEDAQASLAKMRTDQAAAVDEEPAAAPPLEVGKVQALVDMLGAVGAGALEPDTAEVLIVDVFGVPAERAALMLAPYRAKAAAPKPEPAAASPVAEPVAKQDTGRALVEKLVTAKIKREEKPDDTDGQAPR